MAEGKAERINRKVNAYDLLVETLKESKRGHYYCEDGWYSCPLAEGGCDNDSIPEGQCNCGADAHNARIDAALEAAGGGGVG